MQVSCSRDTSPSLEQAASERIEASLEAALRVSAGSTCPPRLARALRHAVMPGGARTRPQLSLAVARACGDDRPELSLGWATAVELIHCASLVHDDLPCFDDAALRRGRPSVHAAFGEPIAVLVGDALIVLAFETLAARGASAPHRLPPLVQALARATGAPHGLVAGQAWESEPHLQLDAYHRAKTASLFVAATTGAALAAGADPAPWARVGGHLGAAYQVADDLLDALASPGEAGKPTGRDAELTRPSAVLELGVEGAVARLRELVNETLEALPICPGRRELEALLLASASRLLPKRLREHAA